MEEKNRYYVVTKKAVPEVLLKVVEAKRLLESAKASTVQEAADMVGIIRSSFYKYKDDIFPFHDNAKGKTITFMIQMDDETGLIGCTAYRGRLSCQYPDDPSEYSDQRHRISDAQCGDPRYDRRYIGDDAGY